MKFYSATLKQFPTEENIFFEIGKEVLSQEGWIVGDEICLKVVKDKIELINQSKNARERKN